MPMSCRRVTVNRRASNIEDHRTDFSQDLAIQYEHAQTELNRIELAISQACASDSPIYTTQAHDSNSGIVIVIQSRIPRL